MKRYLKLFSLTVLIIYSIYLFILPAIINFSLKKDYIQAKIKNQVGLDFVLTSPKVKTGLTPSIIFEADEISAPNLILKAPKLKISLLPLIIKTLKIDSFECRDINAELIFDKNQKLYLGAFPLEPSEQKVSVDNIKLFNYNIKLNDELNNKKININGKHFELKNGNELFISTQFNTDEDIADINMALNLKEFFIQGTITNFDLSDISSYIAKFSDNLVEKVSGIINIEASSTDNITKTNLSTENISLKLKNIEKPFILTPKAVINAKFGLSNKELNITNITLTSKDLNIKLDGSLKNLKAPIPKYDINLYIDDTHSSTILSLIPYMNFPECELNLKKLRDHGAYGLINGKLNIKGENKEPELNGSFVATDLYVKKPLNIPKATLKLDFLGKKIFFDAYVPASQKEFVEVKGDVEFYGSKMANIDIVSSPSVDLQTAEIILIPVHEMLNFEIGPVPIMDIHGIGNIKLKVTGNKEKPHLFGAFNFKNGTVSFNDVNAIFKNASGKLTFNDENMHFSTHHATLNGAPVHISGDCNTQGILNFNATANSQSLNEAVKILNTSPMLKDLSKLTQTIKGASGKINLHLNLKGQMKSIDEFEFGKTILPSGKIKLLGNSVIIENSAFIVKNIKNSEISFDNEKVFFTKLKSDIDSDPISINGEITSLRTNPQLNIHLSAPLTQNFADKYINKFMIYPLLIKGDIDYRAHITGTLDSINLKANANLKKGASLYYKGAILDAQKAPLKADLDLNISKSGFLIRKFQYVQDNSSTILRAFGKIKFHGQTPIFENFKITTFSPADARIFNIIFKKPIIKKGSFTSNVTINGSAFSPSLFGKFNINGVNIPFLDVDINDIDLTFNNHRTDLKLKGEVFSNIITANANIENNFKAPYTINNASVYLGNFNVNTFLTHLDKLTLENVDKVETENNINFNLKDLIIKELNVKAKSVHVRNLSANDMDATLTLNNGLFDLKKATATVAGGSISSKIKYDFKTSIMSISLAMDKINANTISEALFDIKNQFYGNLNGQATLSCNGKTHESCMKTLKGDCSFSVLNGRMPKLGSLEYLLKSSNVLKSGITGLSINNILELLSPLKTGDFESIKGSFTVANGTTKDLKIASKGKDLSIYILGKYNFYDAIADLEIYGRLAKRISNGLGFVGNLSLNTLFNSIPGVNLSKTNQAEFVKLINKIPGIELNTNEFRIFFVKLDGNMNTEEYSQTFKWID